jgi:hypothetical protein
MQMANPLFNALGGNRPPINNNMLAQMMSEFNKFKSSFNGDPKAEVQKLLNSGQMTQDQYNRLSQMANQLRNIFSR